MCSTICSPTASVAIATCWSPTPPITLADLTWIGGWSRGFDVAVRDVADRYAMLAVQGPHARRIVATTLNIDLPPRMRVATARVGGRPALICGTGYTGEDGVELLIDPEVAPAIWAELLDAGVVPCGLGARDTLAP